MSATTTETKGFVAETLRRPIRDAVREGVEEALQEERAAVREREGGPSQEDGGRSWGRLVLLGLISLGAAYAVMRRRGSGSGSRDRTTNQIRERSKTATTPAGSDVGGEESVETMEEGIEGTEEEDAAEGATPGAGSEGD